MKNIFLIISIFFVQNIKAQQDSIAIVLDTFRIKVLACPFEDSVVVRWAPLTNKAWLSGNETGYKIVRYTTTKNGKYLGLNARVSSRKELARGTRPLTMEDWMPILENTDNEFAFLGAGTLYDEEFTKQQTATSIFDLEAMQDDKMRRQMRYGYALISADQSIMVAKAMGLGFVDKDVVRGDGYSYVIEFEDDFSDKTVAIQAFANVVVNKKRNLPAITELQAVFRDSIATINWNKTDVENFYISYILERSDDAGKTFKKVNQAPIMHIARSKNDKLVAYTDSLAENGKLYVYRVRGKSPFEEISPPSDTVQGKGIPTPIALAPQIYDVVEFIEGKQLLRWDFKEELNEEIKGFNLYQATEVKGDYIRVNDTLISAADRLYIDEKPIKTAYYVVKILDNYNREIGGFPVLAQLIDLIAPALPLEIEGTIDEERLVTLTWQPNTEDDLKGYRVFYSNFKNGSYAQVTDSWIRDTTFSYISKIKTTKEEIYFKIAAVDFRDNMSGFSEICTVRLPDEEPPIPPNIQRYFNSEDGVKLTWVPSWSRDVIRHELQRKATDTEIWETVITLEEWEDRAALVDSTASYKTYYDYRIVAIDDADLKAYSKTIKAKPVDNGKRDPISNFEVNIQEDKANISWKYPLDAETRKYVLYRARGKKTLRAYKGFKKEELAPTIDTPNGLNIFSLEDEGLKNGYSYTYQLIAYHKDGGNSRLTPKVTVTTKE